MADTDNDFHTLEKHKNFPETRCAALWICSCFTYFEKKSFSDPNFMWTGGSFNPATCHWNDCHCQLCRGQGLWKSPVALGQSWKLLLGGPGHIQQPSVGMGRPAAPAAGLGAWLLLGDTLTAPGFLTGAVRNTKSVSGANKRTKLRCFEGAIQVQLTGIFGGNCVHQYTSDSSLDLQSL